MTRPCPPFPSQDAEPSGGVAVRICGPAGRGRGSVPAPLRRPPGDRPPVRVEMDRHCGRVRAVPGRCWLLRSAGGCQIGAVTRLMRCWSATEGFVGYFVPETRPGSLPVSFAGYVVIPVSLAYVQF